MHCFLCYNPDACVYIRQKSSTKAILCADCLAANYWTCPDCERIRYIDSPSETDNGPCIECFIDANPVTRRSTVKTDGAAEIVYTREMVSQAVYYGIDTAVTSAMVRTNCNNLLKGFLAKCWSLGIYNKEEV